MQEFVGLGILFLLSFLFALSMLICAFLVRPKSKNKIKNSIYECGMISKGTSNIRFNVQYFIYAILFLIFDVETILLFPFAIAFDKLGLLLFLEVVAFVLILLFGLLYVVKKGVLRYQ